MRFLGESPGVKERDGRLIQCRHGNGCKFQHRSAAMTTFTEAQEAMSKTKESPMKKGIQKAMDAFKHFLK
jgi:hypothetical protein